MARLVDIDADALAASVRKHLGDRYRTEGRGLELANALSPILEHLRSGCRPLPQEIQRALDAAAMIGSGEALRCDSVAVRSSGVLATITEELTNLARGARLASGADLRKVAAATEMVLGQLITRADIAKGRFSRPAVEGRIQASAQVAKSSTLYTAEQVEIEQVYGLLFEKFTKWNEKVRRGEAVDDCPMARCRHFLDLESELHKMMLRRKQARGEIIAGRPRRI